MTPLRPGVVRRLAVLAYHSSPLGPPGEGDSGGMTVYVRDLAAAFARLGVQTDVYTRADGPARIVTSLGTGARVISVEAGPRRRLPKEELTRYVGDFVGAVGAFALAQRLRYDVVHSHYWQSGLAAIPLARGWDAPLIHSSHTLARVKNRHPAPGDRPEPQARLQGEARVIDAADVLVASTDDEWTQLACLYGAAHDKLKTLHPGVDHSVFTPGNRTAARAQLGLTDEAVMLYVGRIQPLKGIELAIRAADQLVPALDQPLRFLIAGGASGAAGDIEVARLVALVDELGLRDVVRFVGPVPHADLPVYYRAADALVVCSHSESFGLTALEAHSCGTPVVGTPVGGLSHVVADEESGFLVDTRDPSVFAARLKTLLADPALRARFGAAAVASASPFSWDRTAASLQELYECLVREQSPEACTC